MKIHRRAIIALAIVAPLRGIVGDEHFDVFMSGR